MQSNVTKKGFSLLLAIIISSVVLAIGLSLLSITVKQLDLSSSSRDSEVAFQAAVAGIECAQSIRWEYANQLLSGADVNASCGDVSISLVDSNGLNNKQNYQVEFDWAPDGGAERCVFMQLFLINQDAGNRNIPSFDGRGISSTCPSGVNCTVVMSQGYSASCATKDDPNSFTVQRELTAEF